MSDHSDLSPSSAHRWIECNGSVQMAKKYPQRDNDAALEGTAAHWVASELVNDRTYSVGHITPFGIAVTEEMIQGAEMYSSAIPEDAFGSLQVEARIDAPNVHPDCWGTADAWWIHDNEINVVDYKFGFSYVDVYENWQMICYAAGILNAIPQLNDRGVTINMTIVQPRSFHREGPVRTWSIRASDLRVYINILRNAAERVMGGAATLQAGSHCKHCAAIHACPAAQAAVQDHLELAHEPVPSDLDPASLGMMLRHIHDAQGMLKAMASGLEEEAIGLIRNGASVPGWNMSPGRGKTEWNKPVEEIVSLGEMLGVKFDKPALITPIQAGALLKKNGIDNLVISAYSTVTSGELKLAPDDVSLTRRVFGNVKGV